MKGLFWFAAGAASATYVFVKGKKLYDDYVPKPIQREIEKRVDGALIDFGRFSATFRAAMAEREEELRNELNIPENNDEN